MPISNRDSKKRIIEISYKNKLSHIASCLEAVDILEEIYIEKRRKDKVILSQGHAGLALYVVLEKHGVIEDAEDMYKRSGTHPDRVNTMRLNELGEMISPVDCSTGSLGHGIGIGLGMALADPDSDIYVVTSDGELQEGSCMEALRIANEHGVDNLVIDVNCNGYGAYKKISATSVNKILKNFTDLAIKVWDTNVRYLPFLDGLEGHYHVMNEEEYKFALERLS